MIPVNNDRLGRFGPRACALFRLCSARALRRLGCRRLSLGVRVANYKRKTLGVRRPLIALQASLQLGKLKGLAAAPVEQPYLAAFGFARPRRCERQVLSIGTPPRSVLAVLAKGYLAVILSVDSDHPYVRA